MIPDHPGRDWIEIELTGPGNVPVHSEGPPKVSGGDTGGGGRRSLRSRTAAIAVATGGFGLLVGWVAGSSGHTSSRAAPEVTTTTTPDVGSNPANFAIPPPDPSAGVSVPDTTVPPAHVVVHDWDVPEQLVGQQYEIAAVRADGTLERLDLDNATRVVSTGIGGPGSVVAGLGWVQVYGPASVLYPDEGRPVQGEVPEPARLFTTPGVGVAWAQDDSLMLGLPGEMVMLDTVGNPTERTARLPGRPAAVDRHGTWIVPAASGTYAVSEDGSTVRITTGEVVALGADIVLAKECEETFTCAYVVVDRGSGERREVDIASSVELRLAGRGESISPDGRFAFAVEGRRERTNDGETAFPGAVRVDLEQGTVERFTLALEDPIVNLYWTDDSHFAFYLLAGGLWAYASESGRSLQLMPSHEPVNHDVSVVGFDVRRSDQAVPPTSAGRGDDIELLDSWLP